ncbi:MULTISPECIES: ABC transporter permease [unclassified Rhizobium]|uniref:ABC transporter permease n=1 Tax=unclassified Rhizobium TaxID=2613769 RepID=UPI00382CB72E
MSSLSSKRTAPQSPLIRGLKSSRSLLGLGLIGGIVALAILGPILAPYTPSELVGIPYDGPGSDNLLGTDSLGRDVLSRFLYGGRNLVWMAITATLLGLSIGTAIGMVSAYFRGTADEILMRLVDIQLAFPSVVFALLFVTMLGPSPVLLVILVGASQAPSVARITRGAALAVVERDYVQWARAVGLPTRKILVSEILPNITSPLLVELGLRLMWSISLLAGLSFLGFGIQPPNADWGLMVNESRNALTIQPWAVLAPIVAIATLSIGGNMFAEGMSRAIGLTEGSK